MPSLLRTPSSRYGNGSSRCPILYSSLASLGSFALRATYRHGGSRLIPFDRGPGPRPAFSNVRTLTLSYTRPLPLAVLALSLICAVLSVSMYDVRPRAILTCTRCVTPTRCFL